MLKKRINIIIRITFLTWVMLFLGVSWSYQQSNAVSELILNGDFENDTANWLTSPGTTIFSIVNDPVHGGTLAAQVKSESNSTKAIVQNISGIIPNNSYILSGYGYRNDPNVVAVRLRVAWYETADCSGSQHSTYDSNALTADEASFIFLTTDAVSAPDTAQCVQVRAQIQPHDANPAQAYFDDLSFVMDSVITPTATMTATNTPPISSTTTPTGTLIPTETATSTPIPVELGLVINEVAWGASQASSSDEWLELYNTTDQAIDLTGWTLISNNGLNIELNGTVPANGYFLLERYDDNTISDIPADQIYMGSLNNDGDTIFLNGQGGMVDSVNSDGGAWAAGIGSPDYLSMERINPLLPDSDDNWTSNNQVYRNGLDADANPINGTPKERNSSTYPMPTPTPTSTSLPPFHGIVINEVAWSGTVADSADEWLELYNTTAEDITLTGGMITSTNGLNIMLNGTILANDYFLLERSDDDTISDIPADQIYAGSLNNNGDTLFLVSGGLVIDSVNFDGGGWAGGIASPDYLSMERINFLQPDTDDNWISNNLIYRNGHDKDGNPINGTPKQQNSITYPTPTPMPTPTIPPTPVFTPTPMPIVNSIIINEVAWAGNAASSSDEWLELYNMTDNMIDLSGVIITSTNGIYIQLDGTIPANGYFLMERTDDNTVADIPADQIYSGGLNNDGDSLFLSSGQSLIDSVNADGGTWVAGRGSPDYLSMERIDPFLADSDVILWASNNRRYRNGLDMNGNPINGTPKQANSTTYPPPPIVPLLISELLYDGLTASTEGDEFVEICNPMPETANLTDYKIGDEETSGKSEGMYRFPDEYQLPADNCLVIAKNASNFSNRFNFLPDFEVVVSGDNYVDTDTVPNLTKYTSWGNNNWALANHSDEMLLLGPDDQILDSVAYRDGEYALLGLTPMAQAPEPYSLQRVWPLDTQGMAVDFYRDMPTPGMFSTLPPPADTSSSIAIADGMNAYFGSLHADSTFSTGAAPPYFLYAQARAKGYHFLAISDRGEFYNDDTWQATENWAINATVYNQFVALHGVNWHHDDFGSINIFGLDEPIHANHPQTSNLTDLYNYISQQPNAIAQFNLPDEDDFDGFAYISHAIPRFYMQEIGHSEVDKSADSTLLKHSWNQGWHVAPSNNSLIQVPDWGGNNSARTGIIAPVLTQADLINALQARRVFATEDSNLALAFRINAHWMGSEIEQNKWADIHIFVRDHDNETVNLTLYDRNVALQNIEVDTPYDWSFPIELLAGHFYWVQAKQADGDMAYTAPIWVAGIPEYETLLINEFLPAPKNVDWDSDGTADSDDEWLEIINPNTRPISLAGWSIGDETTKLYTFGDNIIIQPNGFFVVYRHVSKIAFNNDDDTATLYRPDQSIADEIAYEDTPDDDLSICRERDTFNLFDKCIPTPDEANIVLFDTGLLQGNIDEIKRFTEGALVTTNGYVTVPNGLFGKNVMYIQDDKHGIRIELPTNHGLWFNLGEQVEVIGELDLYKNEWEIDVKSKGDIRSLGDYRFIPPIKINTGMVREGYEGMLVQLDTMPVAFKKRSRSFWVDDSTGLAYIYIYRGTDITRKHLNLESPMTIVGIAGQSTRSIPPSDGYRVYPRYMGDIIQHAPQSNPELTVPDDWPTLLPETGIRANDHSLLHDNFTIEHGAFFVK